MKDIEYTASVKLAHSTINILHHSKELARYSLSFDTEGITIGVSLDTDDLPKLRAFLEQAESLPHCPPSGLGGGD